MDHRKIYTVIAAVLGALYLYAGYSMVMSFVNGYNMDWQFLLYALPVMAGFTGLLVFVISGFKKSGLLRLCLCYELISFPFTVLFYISYLKSLAAYGSFKPVIGLQFYIGVFIDLLYMSCAVAGLWYINKRRVPKIIYFGTGNDRSGQFEPATAGLRFANRAIDGFMIFFIMLKSFIALRFWLDKSWLPDSTAGALLFEIPMILFYYLVLEGIFNISAGKCATSTCILNENGERPTFTQVLGRTFCRLIPFEAFSFLGAGARGWHDSLSNTYVVETVDADDAAMNEITLDAEMNMQQL